MAIAIDALGDSSSSDMDSAGGSATTERSHQRRKRFSIIEISTRDSVRKVMTFETHCAVMPSSWQVEFNLSKGAHFENFAMSITLRRIDTGQVPLQGYAIAFLSNFADKVCPRSYCVDEELPYFESDDSDAEQEVTIDFVVDDHYECLFMDGHETFLYDMLLIKTRLLVMGCCDEDETDEEKE